MYRGCRGSAIRCLGISEAKQYSKAEEKEALKILLDERLYNLTAMHHKSAAVYVNALSRFILNLDPKGEREALYGRIEELYKALKHYAEELEHANEGVSAALIGKIKLGIYNLERTLRRLESQDEIQRLRRRYGLSLTTLIISITIFINLLPSWYQVIIPFISSYGNIITTALISIAVTIIGTFIIREDLRRIRKLR